MKISKNKKIIVGLSPYKSSLRSLFTGQAGGFTGNKKRVVVGMSGGIDSTMALILLKNQGWEPTGVTLKLPVWKSKENILRENICCTDKSINFSRKICKKLKVPYYVFDSQKEFKKEVIDYFVKELKENRTPNPCVICNRYLKFKKLLEIAKKLKAQYVATGHYAKIRYNPKTRKHELLKAKDTQKDQTYYLSYLKQEWLKHIVFPLGEYKKQEIYQLAKKFGLKELTKKRESQDFCFVAQASFKNFSEKKIGKRQGKIVDKEGKVLGTHMGLHFYTIGQRKALGLAGGPAFAKASTLAKATADRSAGKPFYVMDKNFKNNILIVSKNKKDLLKKELIVKNVNWISGEPPQFPLKLKAKIRYRHQPALATIYLLKPKTYQLIFDKPQRAITPGQFCVFYLGNVCLGGGIIC